MAIGPFGWEDHPSTATPLSAANLELDRSEIGAYADSVVLGLHTGTPIEGAGQATTSGTPSTSTQLVAANANRLEIGVSNESGDPAVEVFLGLNEAAVVGQGPRIRPGDPPWVNNNYTGLINMITTAASVPVSYWEV